MKPKNLRRIAEPFCPAQSAESCGRLRKHTLNDHRWHSLGIWAFLGHCGTGLPGVDVVMPFAGERSHVARVRSFLAFVGGFLCLLWQCPLRGAGLDETRQEFIQSHYSNCIHLCQQAIGDQEYNEEWRLLLIQSMMTVGQYSNALSVLTTNLE